MFFSKAYKTAHDKKDKIKRSATCASRKPITKMALTAGHRAIKVRSQIVTTLKLADFLVVASVVVLKS